MCARRIHLHAAHNRTPAELFVTGKQGENNNFMSSLFNAPSMGELQNICKVHTAYFLRFTVSPLRLRNTFASRPRHPSRDSSAVQIAFQLNSWTQSTANWKQVQAAMLCKSSDKWETEIRTRANDKSNQKPIRRVRVRLAKFRSSILRNWDDLQNLRADKQ